MKMAQTCIAHMINPIPCLDFHGPWEAVIARIINSEIVKERIWPVAPLFCRVEGPIEQ